MSTQDALFGDPVEVDDPTPAKAAATQDVELVASVVRAATDPGYRLVERSGRVFRVDPARPGAVETVPRYESETVLQLIDARLLEVGGNHTITYGRNSGPARSVLVPRRTRDMAARWGNLQPLPAPRPAPVPEQRQPDPESEQTSGPIVVDVVRPGRGLLSCREFGGQLVRDGGRYIVETENGHVVGRAASYRAGAQMLARHHGYRPGPIEIDRSEERDGNAPPARTARDRQLGR